MGSEMCIRDRCKNKRTKSSGEDKFAFFFFCANEVANSYSRLRLCSHEIIHKWPAGKFPRKLGRKTEVLRRRVEHGNFRWLVRVLHPNEEIR